MTASIVVDGAFRKGEVGSLKKGSLSVPRFQEGQSSGRLLRAWAVGRRRPARRQRSQGQATRRVLLAA